MPCSTRGSWRQAPIDLCWKVPWCHSCLSATIRSTRARREGPGTRDKGGIKDKERTKDKGRTKDKRRRTKNQGPGRQQHDKQFNSRKPPVTRTFDLIVVGSGAAANAVATRCRAAGWTVAMIDQRPFGGTCALRGCEPKKTLVAAAAAVNATRSLAGKGVEPGQARINWRSE